MTSGLGCIEMFLTGLNPSSVPDWSFGDGRGWTALHHAVFRGDASIVALLLAHGASPFMQDKQGQTPLHIAARQDAQKLVDIILKHVVIHNSNGLLAKEHLLSIRDNKGRRAMIPDRSRELLNEMIEKTQKISSITSAPASTASTSMSSLSSIESVCDSGSSSSTVQRHSRISSKHSSEVYKAH